MIAKLHEEGHRIVLITGRAELSEEVFAFLRKLIPGRNNAFLLREKYRKI